MGQLIQLTLQRRKLFKTINLESLHDNNLSWKAKALHIYLMSRPDGWKLNYADLVNRSTDQRSAVNTAIDELKKHRYVDIHRRRTKSGKYHHVSWTVTESPSELPLAGRHHAEKLEAENSQLEKPQLGKPQSENQQGSKGGFRETEVLEKEGTSSRSEINSAQDELKPPTLDDFYSTPEIRAANKFPANWYKQSLSIYQHLKGLALSGPEFDPLYHELKSIFLAGYHLTEVTGMMWWLNNERWPNWRLSTIRMRIAEWRSGQLQSPEQIQNKSKGRTKQSVSDAKDDLQAFVNGESQTHSDPHMDIDLDVEVDADAEAVSHAAN